MAKLKPSIIIVQGVEIRLTPKNEESYISLTDIAKGLRMDPKTTIQNWMRTRNTVEFLGVWEKINNDDFNIKLNENSLNLEINSSIKTSIKTRFVFIYLNCTPNTAS